MQRLVLTVLLLVAVACGQATGTSSKLVLLAVDGLDPAILSRLIAHGRLPHLAELARSSGVVRVTPTPGAESASSWASLATGTNPGRHGIFDAVAPDPQSGSPMAATLRTRASHRWPGGFLREAAAYAPVRDGVPFWLRLADAGVRSRVLFVPGTFPPDAAPNATVIAGTPLPDWGGGWGAGYTWLASDVPPEEVGYTRYGGRVERLTFIGRTARAAIVGLRRPERVDVPVTVAFNPEDRSANVTVGDETAHLNEGQQSRWLTVTARLSPIARAQGLLRVLLVKAGNEVQIYVSPIQWHPAQPPSAIAAPAGAASTLFARLGSFRTLAWPESAWAFADGRLSEEHFAAAQEETFEDRAAALLNQAESGGWDLLAAGIETLNASTRLRWPQDDAGGAPVPSEPTVTGRDRVMDGYARLDRLIGDLRARVPAATAIVVLSPHGLARTGRVVDLNRWLTTRGWLAWRDQPRPVTLAALAAPDAWTDTVDVERTRARAMGAGHIYLRQADEALVAELKSGLEGLTDPDSGERVVSRVRRAAELYTGPHLSSAPDVVVTWAPGFRGSWDAMLGGAAADVVAANDERWVADHAGVDERYVPGVWLSTFPLGGTAMSVLDVAPTISQFFGLAAGDVDGHGQLRAMPTSASRR